MTAITFLVLLAAPQVCAQETPRVEVGLHVTTLNLGDFKLKIPDLSKSERGAGGRVTINFSDNVALEGEYNVFPSDFRLTVPQLNQLVTRKLTRDRVNQFLLGIKAGKRSDHFGIFAKVRPGFVSGNLEDETVNPNSALNTLFRTSSGLALDMGIVLEFYPSRHTMLRFDIGDTIIRYETKPLAGGSTGSTPTGRFTAHNLQISAGVGLRF
jgi:hypothetical protein